MKKRSWKIWHIAFLLAVPVLPLIWFDSHTLDFHSYVQKKDHLDDIINPLREFGGFFVQAVILLTMFTLDPPRRRKVLVVVAAVLLSFLAAQGLKILSGRGRPEIAIKNRPVQVQMKAGTFTGPWGGVFDDDFGSFPSGHATSAFALATALAMTYPRGRWIFYLLALGCGLARISAARHYPTDVYAGALVGMAATRWLIYFEGTCCRQNPTGS